tara:strand:- start:6179 stop:10180 length:4002 start_codon:yes stop_codon:yes gene_type:complete
MALSKSEYFKNIFTTIVQSTGSIVNAQSPEEMRAFVRAAKIDAAINVRNWNKFVFPIMKTLRSAPEHEYDVLDAEKGGLSGWTITTELWATEDSMECLWDFTRGQPHSITGSILCLAAKIAAIAAEKDHEHEVYDDTSIKGLIECIELNLEQAKKDLFGECYIWDCDGDPNLTYPLARHIHEIFKQVIAGAPSLGLDGCFPGEYPTLTFEILVSKFVYDILIPSTGIEYCGTTLANALGSIKNYVGQSDCTDETPAYSTKTPAPTSSAGNHVLNDGDDLTTGLKTIDHHMTFYTGINALADGGSVGGAAGVKAAGIDNLILSAGSGISLEFTDSSTTGGDTIKISSTVTPGSEETLQLAYDAGGPSGTGGKIVTKNTWPMDGKIVFQEANEIVDSATGTYGLKVNVFEVEGTSLGEKGANPTLWGTGKHFLYIKDIGGTYGSAVTDLQSTGEPAGPSTFKYYANESYSDMPLILRSINQFTPDTGGPSHPNAGLSEFLTERQGALWVSDGTQAVKDRDGQAQIDGHLYYREPSGGDIWHLLCCGSSSSGGAQNLQETYDFDSSDSGSEKDGGKIVLDITANTPAGIHIYDGTPSVVSPAAANWLSLYDYPLLAVGKPTQAADADAYFSVSRIGNNEVAVNAHHSPINLSTRADGSDPLTSAQQGSLFSKNVTTDSGTEAHIHWRCPSSGTVYDLTNTGGGGGGAGQAWRTITLATQAGSVGSSFSGDSTLTAAVIADILQIRAGDYIGMEGTDLGTGDIIKLNVNPMPTTFLSDVDATAADAGKSLLWWNNGASKYIPGVKPTCFNLNGGTSSSGGAANIFYATLEENEGGVSTAGISRFQHQFRRIVAGTNVTVEEVGSGGRDIKISASGGSGSGATKTTELTDVHDTWPGAGSGAILTWNSADEEYDPSYFVNVGTGAEVYKSYDTTSKQHQFRELKSTGSYSGAIDITQATNDVEFAFDPSALTLDDFADVATGSDYPAAGSDGGAVLAWDSSTNKWKKSWASTGSDGSVNTGFDSVWLMPSEWDQRSCNETGIQVQHLTHPDVKQSSTGTYAELAGARIDSTESAGHFENSVIRYAREPSVGSGGDWLATNGILFYHGEWLTDKSQPIYAKFPIPRTWNGTKWEYPTKMWVTGYFCMAQGVELWKDLIANINGNSGGALFDADGAKGFNNYPKYCVTLPFDTSITKESSWDGDTDDLKGKTLTLVDGSNMRDYAAMMGDVYEGSDWLMDRKKTPSPVTDYDYVSVIKFGNTATTTDTGTVEEYFTLTRPEHSYWKSLDVAANKPLADDGLMVVRLNPVKPEPGDTNDPNIFSTALAVPHIFLGMRIDFT